MPLLYSELYGLKEQQQSFVALKDWMNDLTGFWNTVFAPKYFKATQDLFKTSGTPRDGSGQFSGAPWMPLSERYAQWKYKHFPGQPILTKTGALAESLTWYGTGLGPSGIWMVTPKSVAWGTSIPYGKALQHGSEKRNLPARPFLLTPDPAVFGPLLKQWLLMQSGFKTAKGGTGAGSPGGTGTL